MMIYIPVAIGIVWTILAAMLVWFIFDTKDL